MLKKIISKALLTVAIDSKARKKINGLGGYKRLLRTRIQHKNIKDLGPLPKKLLNEQAHIDASHEPRKRASNPTKQIENPNKLNSNVLTGARVGHNRQSSSINHGTSINPERKALITEALTIRRSKLHILHELDQEQLDKLTAMAIQALNIQIKS